MWTHYKRKYNDQLPLHKFPEQWAPLFYDTQRNHKKRFVMAKNLAANGVHPETAYEIASYRLTHGKLDTRLRDKKIKYHQKYFGKMAKTRDFWFKYNSGPYASWDVLGDLRRRKHR